MGRDDKFNDVSIPPGAEYRGDPHAALLIAAIRRPCFGSMESVSDYSGDHKNTRDVTQIPRKLLLSIPARRYLSQQKWFTNGRNALRAVPRGGNFLLWEGFGQPLVQTWAQFRNLQIRSSNGFIDVRPTPSAAFK